MRSLFLPAAALSAALLATATASAHDVYSGLHDPYTGTLCCDGTHCYPLDPDNVRRVDEGWEFRDRSGILRSVKARQAQPSPDGRYHYCYWGDMVRCFMVPATM